MSKQYYAIHKKDSNELTHWKYIKREKGSNGKWKYYYDKESLQKDVSNTAMKIDETKNKIEYNIKDKLGYDERDARDKAIADNQKALDNLNKTKGTDEYDNAVQQLNEASDKALKAIAKYSKTPIGMMDRMQESIEYGLHSVKKYLVKK